MTMIEKWLRTNDGLYLRYRLVGSGPALICLHGNGGDLHYFDRLVPFLSTKYQLVLLDQRDHGRSDKARAPYSFAEHVADVHAILTAEKLSKVDILGFSDGAILALLFAKEHPTLVKNLVLNAPNIELSGLRQPERLAFVTAAHFLQALNFLPPLQQWSRRLELIVSPIPLSWRDLALLPHSALVLVGQHDLVKARHSQKIAASLPHGQLATLANGSHRVAQEQPAAFAAHVLSFLLR